jgi:hypothetical protein
MTQQRRVMGLCCGLLTRCLLHFDGIKAPSCTSMGSKARKKIRLKYSKVTLQFRGRISLTHVLHSAPLNSWKIHCNARTTANTTQGVIECIHTSLAIILQLILYPYPSQKTPFPPLLGQFGRAFMRCRSGWSCSCQAQSLFVLMIERLSTRD